MKIKNIIFDLDGTLIDSSKSILESFREAFQSTGNTPTIPLEPSLIGPPLKETLAKIAGSRDSAQLDRLAGAFKAHYDTEGYKSTDIFNGVPEMLAQLSAREMQLYIATNKRAVPTLLILDYLGWTPIFTGIYALDSFDPPFGRKSDLLGHILSQLKLSPSSTLYVGDRKEDGEAASNNGIYFAGAYWGYGSDIESGESFNDLLIETPLGLVDRFITSI